MGNTAEQLLFETMIPREPLNETDITRAKEIFIQYEKMGVFYECTFEDKIWITTDEYSHVGIHYNINQLLYNRFYSSMFGLSYSEFIQCLKVFVTYTLGKIVLKSLQSFINDMKRIIKTNPEDIYKESANLKISVPALCIDFISTLPEISNETHKEDLINALDFYISISFSENTHNQRTLAQFDSYFLFNDIMNDYWRSSIPDDERIFYYPLYLWWNITGVIPLRPREFILTKRNCLQKRDDGYYITLRRDDQKGSGKSIHYKIIEDYYEVTYKIPNNLANEILQYLSITKEYENTEINTLFVTDPHYHHWGQKKHSNSRFMTYINMNTIMKYFFNDIINKRYHLKIVYEKRDCHLNENEINYIHLGDTRHLALINLMAEGGTPLTAMLLAGHDNTYMSSFYYSNISNLIECRTYRQYRLVTKGNVSYSVSNISKVPVKTYDFQKLSDGGKCYSDKYKNGDISDCMESSGKNGELGYCLNCKYYRKNGTEYFTIDNKYKKNIKDNCKLLIDAVKMVRLGKGNEEDIGEAVLKLQNSSYSYEEYKKDMLSKINAEGKNIWEEIRQ